MPSLMTFDGTYFFLGDGEVYSNCRIRIFEDLTSSEYTDDNLTYVVVVATMLWEHPQQGSSIVNVAEQLATEIYNLQLHRQHARTGQRRKEIDTFEWYQHLPTSPSLLMEESIDLVEFQGNPTNGGFHSPHWVRCPKIALEHKIGQPLR